MHKSVRVTHRYKTKINTLPMSGMHIFVNLQLCIKPMDRDINAYIAYFQHMPF